jgi:hypothetical protein
MKKTAPGGCRAWEFAAELDKEWFKVNPHRSHRIRCAVADELPGVVSGDYVVVRQLWRGLRLRWPFVADKPLPTGEAPEHVAEAVFNRFYNGERSFGLRVGGGRGISSARPQGGKDTHRRGQRGSHDVQ